MKSRCVVTYLVLASVLFVSMLGCAEKEETSPAEDEMAREPSVQVIEPQTPEQSISPVMEQFLSKTIGTQEVTAGHQIRELFDLWEQVLYQASDSMDIDFEIELEEQFQKDHIWENKTHREVLDDLCRENGLVWTITGPNTIHISKKAE